MSIIGTRTSLDIMGGGSSTQKVTTTPVTAIVVQPKAKVDPAFQVGNMTTEQIWAQMNQQQQHVCL